MHMSYQIRLLLTLLCFYVLIYYPNENISMYRMFVYFFCLSFYYMFNLCMYRMFVYFFLFEFVLYV